MNSSVASTPIGRGNDLKGTPHFFLSASAEASEVCTPNAMVSLQSPRALISLIKVPPFGNISYLPVIGPSNTPVVSGSIMKGTFIAFNSFLYSLISPGFTKAGIKHTFSLEVPVLVAK